jgi:hypothetical protein
MTAETIDQILSMAALAVPVLAVVGIRNRLLAIFFGTVSAWLILDASSDWIHKFDPEYEPNSISNTIWTGLGWIPALIYSSLLWFAKMQIQKLGKKQNEKGA